MTLITFQDGKPVMRDGKVGTGQGCCCGNPLCCQHSCIKMCCTTVRFALPGGYEVETSVGPDCRATVSIPDTSVQIRVQIRCSGYVYGESGEKDCDTDCEIVAVEYSEDGGTTWTTTPPSAASGATWSIYCSDGGGQPEPEVNAPRCADLTTLNAAQCTAAGGEPCTSPCSSCGLACGPGPTEWRLRRGNTVWFQGDIIENPNRGGDVPCTTPDQGSVYARWLLDDFPFNADNGNGNTGAGTWCENKLAGWPVVVPEGGMNLIMEVLGCNGNNWEPVSVDPYPTTDCISTFAYPAFLIPSTEDPCELRLGPEPRVGLLFRDGSVTIKSPPGCSCLRDPATGGMIGYGTSGLGGFCCPQCNHILGTVSECGATGLAYLFHGVGVRFTGSVDNEGSNLWNWQDSLGRSPAGSLPTGDIVITGQLRSWRKYFIPNWPAPPEFDTVTLEPGAVLAISVTTETLTVDDAAIEELMLDQWGTPKSCANGDQYVVSIVVTGAATFKNGAENHAAGFTPLSMYGITGNCVFESGSVNFGSIAGNCDFSDDARNDGEIAGNCTFSGDAVNNGIITGDATFSGNARNAGTVTGTATFTGSACNAGGTAGTFDPDPPPAC